MSATLKPIIAPSLLASDLCCAAEDARRMIQAGCDWLHIDVMFSICMCFHMSGQEYIRCANRHVVHFVPNLSVGPGWVKCLRKHFPDAFFDVHLMVETPIKWIEPFADAGANSITFHWEATKSPTVARDVAQAIRKKGIKAGLALKPGTQLQDIGTTLENPLPFDMVLVMTVEPGFGGQKFMPEMTNKIKEIRSVYPGMNIQVDGGLDAETVKIAAAAGANVVVAGTSMFTSKTPEALMKYMREGGIDIDEGLESYLITSVASKKEISKLHMKRETEEYTEPQQQQ